MQLQSGTGQSILYVALAEGKVQNQIPCFVLVLKNVYAGFLQDSGNPSIQILA